MSVSITNSVVVGLKEHKKQQIAEENEAMDDLYNESDKQKNPENEPTKEIIKNEEIVDYTEVEEG
jgi:hypothetical protein